MRKSEPERLGKGPEKRFKTSPKRVGDSAELEEEKVLITEPITPKALLKLSKSSLENIK